MKHEWKKHERALYAVQDNPLDISAPFTAHGSVQLLGFGFYSNLTPMYRLM